MMTVRSGFDPAKLVESNWLLTRMSITNIVRIDQIYEKKNQTDHIYM